MSKKTKARTKGEGSISQSKRDGNWRVQISLGRDANGRRIRPQVCINLHT